MNTISDASPIATTDQYRAALLAVRQRMTDVQLKILQTHCRSSEHTISLNDLADLLGLASWSGARTAYKNYARLIAAELKFVPNSPSNKPIWLCAIAYERPVSELEDEWTMRPELVQALQAMKWA